jgi:hypothetical protein
MANVVQARYGTASVDPAKEKERARQDLQVRIAVLEVERVGKKGAAKGKITSQINTLERERDALR